MCSIIINATDTALKYITQRVHRYNCRYDWRRILDLEEGRSSCRRCRAAATVQFEECAIARPGQDRKVRRRALRMQNATGSAGRKIQMHHRAASIALNSS